MRTGTLTELPRPCLGQSKIVDLFCQILYDRGEQAPRTRERKQDKGKRKTESSRHAHRVGDQEITVIHVVCHCY